MATVKLKFRASSVKGKAGVLYYQIIQQRVTRQISTDYRITVDQWDKVNQIVLNHEVRHKTQNDIELLTRIIQQFDELADVYTADDVVKKYTTDRQQYTLFNYMPKMAVWRKQLGNTRTAEGYICALNSFKRFRQNEDVMLNEINATMMEKYQAWLKNNNLVPNTISFYMRKLRATYNQAVEDELIFDKKPFKRVFTGTEKTKKRALPLQELSKVKNVDLSDNPAREFARDMFMLSFYLRGMAFVDLAFLKKSDLRGGVVTYRRHKTNQQIQVQWTDEMQQILDKYQTKNSKYLLPIIPANCDNEQKAYTNRGHAINYHLKKLGEQLNISLKFTFYTSRHSWTTVARDKGVAISVISEGLGYESERTTRIYLASLDSSVIDNANKMIIQAV
jgi:site-specific recombinase XerD